MDVGNGQHVDFGDAWGQEAAEAGEQALRSSLGHLMHQGCPSLAVLSQGSVGEGGVLFLIIGW